jgi:hypothetical protein
VEKAFEFNQNKWITEQVDNHTPTPNPTQDLKCAQCKSKGKSNMMLKK